jgi:ABC-2 type transport system permease protein
MGNGCERFRPIAVSSIPIFHFALPVLHFTFSLPLFALPFFIYGGPPVMTPPSAQSQQPQIPDRSPSPVWLLMRAVWLQSLRRNEFYVFVILLALYLIGGLVARLVNFNFAAGTGPEAARQAAQNARFVAGLGLQMGSALSSLLVIVLGARQIPAELEQRTIYPVLAKPVTRGQVLLGKALPMWLLGMMAMLMFMAVTLAVTPRDEHQQVGVLLQALGAKGLALAMLTALVLWMSLWLPSGVAMLLAGATAFLGTTLANWLTGLGRAGGAVAALIPDFKLFDQFLRFVDGGAPVEPALLARLMIYGGLWLLIFSGLALARFRRQPL